MTKSMGKTLRQTLLWSVAVASFALFAGTANADMAAAKKWVDNEFQPSTLTKEQQMKEMEWFIKAAEPFKGMHIKVVSETIPTHAYESKTLAKAFEEITGIHVTHDVIQEGDVVEKLQTQVQTGKPIYDAYINDDDFIGFHARYPYTRNLTAWMKGEGKSVTDPYLDLNDLSSLHQRRRLHRLPRPLSVHAEPDGLDGRRRQVRHRSLLRSQRLPGIGGRHRP